MQIQILQPDSHFCSREQALARCSERVLTLRLSIGKVPSAPSIAIIRCQAANDGSSSDDAAALKCGGLMHVELLRSLLSPLRLWRTILLVTAVGFAVATFSGDALAVFCSTLACAFVFSTF